MDNKEVKPIPGGPVLKEALQGATLGFGEEALAGIRSMIPGEDCMKAFTGQILPLRIFLELIWQKH